MTLARNPPLDRLKFIIKTYGEKQPWVVLDTLGVIFNTIGIDSAEGALAEALVRQGSDVWGDKLSTMMSRVQSMLDNVGLFRVGLVKPSQQYMFNVPYRAQLGYWWFGDPELEQRIPRPARPVSTLVEKLSLVLELADDPDFADGAMREPHEADGIFPWVARELSKLSRRTINAIDAVEPDAEWDASPAEYNFYKQSLNDLRDKTGAIAQWAKLKRVDLMKLSLAEVFDAIKDFRYSGKARQGKVVYRFSTGWSVQELRGRRELEPEGKVLGHCAGSYCAAVDEGESVVYSLRDPDGVPYVTMEWQPRRARFAQVFGFRNSRIGDETFNSYVFQAGQHNDPPLTHEEVRDAAECIRAMVAEFIDKKKSGNVDGLRLAGISFVGRDMRGSDLRQANLAQADLTDANLAGCNMTLAFLTAAILRHANLAGCDMSSTRGEDADLYKADLNGANLTGANLTEAVYDAATVWPAGFVPAATRAVRG